MNSDKSRKRTSQVTWWYVFEPVVLFLLWLAAMLVVYGALALLEWVIGYVF